LICAAVAVAAGLVLAPRSEAQFGSSGMGGPDPGAMFSTKQKEAKDTSGPSLTATDEPVAAIHIEGNRSIPTTQILREIQTRVGRPFDPTLVQRDVRKLASKSWFVDVQPAVERTPEGRVVTFRVVERPVIRYVQYLGNEGIKDKKLAKETELKVGGSVDPYAVEEARRKLIALYHTNGYNDVQITVVEGTKPTDHGVVFVINEGKSKKVWDVEFVGNKFVSGRRLKTQIKSKPPILMLFKGYVDSDEVDADVQRLTAYYRSFGFFQAKVSRTLKFNEGGNWLTLTFVINEGPRYQVRSVKFMGNQLFAGSSLAMGVELQDEHAFEQAKMNSDLEWLKELYGSQGYVFADIRAEPVFLEEPGQLDLLYHIEEGKQWRVGRVLVHISGENPHTRIETALNRLSLRPGEIMDIREVRASERRLQASGLYMTDPAKGVMPKITYRIREIEDTQTAGTGGNVRGQSPDDVVPRSTYEPASRHGGRRPPESETGPVTFGGQTYEVRRPADSVENAIDVYLEFEDLPPSEPSEKRGDPAANAPSSPTAQPYVVNRPPYDDLEPNVRLQSPYPSVPTQTYPADGGGYSSSTYSQRSYGGQAVGATGPDATPAGYGAGGVRQAAITEPQLPPAQGTTTAPTYAAPQTAPSCPAPGPVLAPDPRITPLPVNPLLFPNGPIDPFAAPYSDPTTDVVIDVSEAQTGRLMLGVAVNSDAGLMGQVLIDEQNFDWQRLPTSWNDLASGKAFRGAGQRFRIEAAPGTEVQRYLASFQEPYLWDTPISLGLSASYYDRLYTDWDEQRLGGRVSLGYQWTANDLMAAIAYRGENVNIRNISRDIPELLEVKGDNVLHGFRLTLANDTRDSAFLATTGHYAEVSFEQVIGSFVYPRAELDIRQYALMYERPDHSGRHVLSYSSRLGFTGDNTPVYDRYFAGGYSTMRGFDFRGASPVKEGVRVGGDFEWLNTFEYLFPLTADDMMHGVAFVDYGTVAENVTLHDMRVSPGLGLRITVPALGPAPIALDFAWPVASAPYDDKQVFSFSIGLQR
jgi:outer membrane protein insertion porin family